MAQILVPKGIVVPSYEPLPTHYLRLRWQFDFAGKDSKKGSWDGSSPRAADSATRVNKTGLVRACIEGESKLTGDESIIVECQGQDYAFFQWEGYQQMRVGRDVVSGLSLFTRYARITVWVNGRVDQRPLTAEESAFQFEEHSV